MGEGDSGLKYLARFGRCLFCLGDPILHAADGFKELLLACWIDFEHIFGMMAFFIGIRHYYRTTCITRSLLRVSWGL